jgi:hypothetical protein
LLQPYVATGVPSNAVRNIVTHAIDLDGPTRLRATEIEDIRSDWLLSSESRPAVRAMTNAFPQQSFRKRNVASDFAGLCSRL